MGAARQCARFSKMREHDKILKLAKPNPLNSVPNSRVSNNIAPNSALNGTVWQYICAPIKTLSRRLIGRRPKLFALGFVALLGIWQNTPANIDIENIDPALSRQIIEILQWEKNNQKTAGNTKTAPKIKQTDAQIPLKKPRTNPLKTSAKKPQKKAKKKPIPKVIERTIEKNLWHYIANRYQLKGYNHPQLDGHIRWFEQNTDYLTRVSKRATPYLYLITQAVEKAGLPIELALLPIVESAYYPFSYSHGTASGLWQFIPATGKLYGLKQNWWYDGRRDVAASTRAAVKYLKNLNQLFKGDWLLAIAAYNSGPGRVQKAIIKNRKQGKKTDFWHLDLPVETRGYVPRLLAVAQLIKNPKAYNQTITAVPNAPQIGSVTLKTQLDLSVIAQWSSLDLDKIYELNPGLKRWATPPNSQHTILLPLHTIAKFNQNMQKHAGNGGMRWVRHRVQKGESLTQLAKQFKTQAKQIAQVNHLKNNTIKHGDYLIIPMVQKSNNHSAKRQKNGKKNDIKSGFKITHKVASGESLWRIARQYHTDVSSIARWNQLSSEAHLKIGQALIIWQSYSKNSQHLSQLTDTGVNINRKITYRVRRGDNLSKIAHKFRVRMRDVRQWNRLKINQPLQPGQKLKLIINVINSTMQ